MLEVYSQENTTLSPEAASVWGGQGVKVRPSSLQCWAWDCLPSGLLPSLPSSLQAELSRVLGQWATGQVSPRRAFGKRLEGGCGWEEAGSFFLSSQPWVPSLAAAAFVS